MKRAWVLGVVCTLFACHDDAKREIVLSGAIAGVGEARLDATTLRALLHAHPEWTPADATEHWVHSALISEEAKRRGVLTESHSNGLVRRLYAHWNHEAATPAQATPAEIQAARQEEWQRFDRPTAYVVHHMVLMPAGNAGAKNNGPLSADFLAAANALARSFASQAQSDWDFAKFDAAAKALTLPSGMQLRAEQLQPFVADGRQVEGMGGYDPIFARESAKLQRPGDLTAPFETPFGVHVVQLERIEPEIRRSDAEIATEIERELVQRRVQRLQSEAIARQRARAPVTIEPTAQADMERLIQQMFGELAP